MEMTRNKKVLYVFATALPLCLFLVLVLPIPNSRLITAALMLVFSAALRLFVKKRVSPIKERRAVCGLLTLTALVSLMLLYLTGLHFGFYKSQYPYTFEVLIKYVLPISAIVISAESARSVLMAQDSRAVAVLCYVYGVLADVLMNTSVVGITSFARFMDVAGMSFIPAVTSNLLYCYLSKRYGALTVLPYRLLFALYKFALPVFPKIPDALLAFAKLLLPLAVLLFIRVLYERRKRSHRNAGKLSAALTAVLVAIMVAVIGVVSCQFTYGALVIATESMTGDLNKGDAVIYEKYDGEIPKVGQVIVYEQGGVSVVHRVVDVEHIDGQTRYYTKGDANDDRDVGYITDAQITGVVKARLRFAGYPTLWLRSIFDF